MLNNEKELDNILNTFTDSIKKLFTSVEKEKEDCTQIEGSPVMRKELSKNTALLATVENVIIRDKLFNNYRYYYVEESEIIFLHEQYLTSKTSENKIIPVAERELDKIKKIFDLGTEKAFSDLYN